MHYITDIKIYECACVDEINFFLCCITVENEYIQVLLLHYLQTNLFIYLP